MANNYGRDEYRGRGVPEHLIRQIRQMYRAGLSVRKIMYATGLSSHSVQKYRRLTTEAQTDGRTNEEIDAESNDY